MRWSETFVVYKGRGRLRTQGEAVELAPGVVIDVRKGVPYVLEIFETLEKVAVVTLEN
jgi:mannose-6-phosphate isomerase-like protein (cupin superfamily)